MYEELQGEICIFISGLKGLIKIELQMCAYDKMAKMHMSDNQTNA